MFNAAETVGIHTMSYSPGPMGEADLLPPMHKDLGPLTTITAHANDNTGHTALHAGDTWLLPVSSECESLLSLGMLSAP